MQIERSKRKPGIGFFLWICCAYSLCIGQMVWAGSLYKWVDEEGNVVYQDTPPPSSVNFEEQTYSDPNAAINQEVSDSLNNAAEESPVSFYSIPNCDSCDLVRLYLENNSIPFTEKDIQTNVSLQQELEGKAGQLKVPTVSIGDLVIDGYSKSSLRQGLIDKGYPVEEIESGEAIIGEEESEVQEIVEGLSAAELERLDKEFEENNLGDDFGLLDPVVEIQAE